MVALCWTQGAAGLPTNTSNADIRGCGLAKTSAHVHHAVRARICIERGRYWQAEYWISGTRDYALSLACRRRGLSPFYGRGFDDLPTDVRDRFIEALATSIQRDALLTALRAAIDGLLQEASDLQESVAKVEPRLREMMQR